MGVLNRAFDHPMKFEECATVPFAGGIMQHGYQCGMIWGSALAGGVQAYQHFGVGPLAQAVAILTSQRLVKAFHALNNNINCFEITNLNKSSTAKQMIIYFLIKGGSIGCFHMAAKYARVAFTQINNSISREHTKVPSPPVSCVGMLAQQMGMSDIHTAMVSGFAGGIGLCGGACGVLGAAIWFLGMNVRREHAVENLWNDKVFKSRFDDLIDRFLESSGYEFECSEIIGRRFKNVEDHVDYLRDGGCVGIIEALATS